MNNQITNADLEGVLDKDAVPAGKIEISDAGKQNLRAELKRHLMGLECPEEVAARISGNIDIKVVCLEEHASNLEDPKFIDHVAAQSADALTQAALEAVVMGVTDFDGVADYILETCKVHLIELSKEEASQLQDRGVTFENIDKADDNQADESNG